MTIADVTLLDLIEHEFEAAQRERAWAEFSRYWTACERALDRYRKRVGGHWKTADEILFRTAWSEAELARRRGLRPPRPVRQAMSNEHFRALLRRRDELQSEHETACAMLEEEGADRHGVLRCMGVYAELTALQQRIDDELETERLADAGEQGGSA